jgi:hypothetical protein
MTDDGYYEISAKGYSALCGQNVDWLTLDFVALRKGNQWAFKGLGDELQIASYRILLHQNVIRLLSKFWV